MKKEWKELRKKAEAQGWRVIATQACHWKWLAPDGKTTVVSGGTTSDHRGIRNQIAMMRRAGFRD